MLLHYILKRLADAQDVTKIFELRFVYNVSSISEEENGVKMTKEKSYIVWKMIHGIKTA